MTLLLWTALREAVMCRLEVLGSHSAPSAMPGNCIVMEFLLMLSVVTADLGQSFDMFSQAAAVHANVLRDSTCWVQDTHGQPPSAKQCLRLSAL